MTMSKTMMFACLFTTLLSCILPQPAHTADRDGAIAGISEATDFITTIPSIFWDWVNAADKIVIKEKRKQFIRKVDNLRKDLYKLEIDKRFLLDSIPDKDPDVDLIQQNIDDLKQTLGNLQNSLKDIGADMRAEQGTQIEELIRNSVSTRTKGLDEINVAVENPNYDAEKIRQTLMRGIAAVNAAQIAVTAFYNQISKKA